MSTSCGDPSVRGPRFRDFLNLIAITYEPERKENYKKFFDILGSLIPCEECRTHYKVGYFISKPDLTSKESLLQWIGKIHNNINAFNGKKTRTSDEQMSHYESKYVENRIILREISQGGVFGYEIQGIYDDRRRGELSKQEKIEAILSCPNNLYQDGELYHFDGVNFKTVTI